VGIVGAQGAGVVLAIPRRRGFLDRVSGQPIGERGQAVVVVGQQELEVVEILQV